MLRAPGLAPIRSPPPPKLFEVDSASFVKEVLESVDPVIVFACSTEQKNFVAPLAQAVQATAGVRLALLDTIACADIAQQLRIENSPTMLAFIGGKCMDMSPVQGQLDQEAAAGHVQKVMLIAKTKDATMAMAEAGRLLSTGELEESLKLYMHVQTTAKDTHGGPATAGMVLCAIQLKDVEAARGLADSIRRDFPKDVEDPIVKQALNAVEFAEMGASDLNVGDLEAKVAADANDHQARHDLALALFGSSKYQEAFDHGLEIIKRERGWEAGKARELLFKFFDTLGSAHPMVVAARKRMASLMF